LEFGKPKKTSLEKKLEENNYRRIGKSYKRKENCENDIAKFSWALYARNFFLMYNSLWPL